MSVHWLWVFLVAGNSHCWKPSEVVSTQHFEDPVAAAESLQKDQKGRQKESLLWPNLSHGWNGFFCPGVCVLILLSIRGGFFSSVSEHREEHFRPLPRNQRTWLLFQICNPESWQQGSATDACGHTRKRWICFDQGLEKRTFSAPSLKCMVFWIWLWWLLAKVDLTHSLEAGSCLCHRCWPCPANRQALCVITLSICHAAE